MMRFEHIGYGDEGEREQKADESEHEKPKLLRLFLLRCAELHSLSFRHAITSDYL